MCELCCDGGSPLWCSRVDAWALAATSAPSLLGLRSVSEEVRAEGGPKAAQGPALLPLRGARRRRRGLARLAVAKTPWPPRPRTPSTAGHRYVYTAVTPTRGAAQVAAPQRGDDVYGLVLQCALYLTRRRTI